MDWRARLQQAVTLHQAGRLGEAIAAYRDVLAERGDNADALHLLGMALEQAGVPAQGLAFVELATRIDPQVAAYHNSLGNIHRALGDAAAARAAYRAALERDAAFAAAYDNLGLLDQEAGDWPAALAHFKAALAIDAGLLSARLNLATTEWLSDNQAAALPLLAAILRDAPYYAAQILALAKRQVALGDAAGAEALGGLLNGSPLSAAERHLMAGLLARLRQDTATAEREFQAALAFDPGHIDVLGAQAKLLCDREAYADAVPLLERILSLRPDEAPALIALAIALCRSGSYDRAIPLLRQSLTHKADDTGLLAELARSLDKVERVDEACEIYYRLIAMMPQEPSGYTNLSALELRRGNLAAARQAAETSLSLQPEAPAALGNLANIRGLEKRFDEAIALYRRLIALNPEDGTSHNNLALLLLRLGRYAEAWPHFSWRWKSANWSSPERSQGLPRWDGRLPPPRGLLLWREQGIGDEILFASLLPEFAAVAAEVVLTAEPRLVPLFSRSFPGIRVVADDAPAALAPGLTAQAPIGDLGAALRPTAEAFARHPGAYLKADPARRAQLRERYDVPGKLLVGLSWVSRNPRTGRTKSLQLADMVPFLREPETSFVSLQYGPSTTDIDMLHGETGLTVRHDPEIDPLRDIDGQAAQIAALDLVVTVSTAAAHIAAALGVPTLILLPDEWGQLWYWGESGERTPWYPSVRLCRAVQGAGKADMIERALTMFRAMRTDRQRV